MVHPVCIPERRSCRSSHLFWLLIDIPRGGLRATFSSPEVMYRARPRLSLVVEREDLFGMDVHGSGVVWWGCCDGGGRREVLIVVGEVHVTVYELIGGN